MRTTSCIFFFFFNDTATTEIYTLSLHDALPILTVVQLVFRLMRVTLSEWLGDVWVGFKNPHIAAIVSMVLTLGLVIDRKSTRLNSSHLVISYAVFCLKKKKKYTWSTLCVSTSTI